MRNFRIFLFFALLALLPSAAHAQFLGYVSPQTLQQTLASGVNCTGAAQNFVVQNLGQTQHFATANSGSATEFQFAIQGLDVQNTVYPISDYGKISASGSVGRASIQGTGYFPVIRVQVTCLPVSAVFSVNYSGTSSTASPSIGTYQFGQIDKMIFSGAAANASATDFQFLTPFASSSGTLFFNYVTAAVAGSTLNVSCQGQLASTGVFYTQTFTLANSIGIQTFPVPGNACPLMTVTYNSGGATAGTVFLEYLFNTPGISGSGAGSAQSTVFGTLQPATAENSETTSATNAAAQVVLSGAANKTHYVFSVSARCSAGTAQLTLASTGGNWSTAATEVSTTTFRYQWSPGFSAGLGNSATITLSTCGVGNTGTLDVQASQF